MIKIGIVGYGNLGRAIESAASVCDDITVNAIFSRRASSLRAGNIPIYGYGDIEAFDKALDCLVLASGSSADLPVITQALASKFNTVDSFDDHSGIKEHYKAVDLAAKKGGKISVISAGWDPGLLSLIRLYSSAFMPGAAVNTFWGEGISQGHSEALRRIPGVIDAVQVTVPKQEYIDLARKGKRLSARESHRRKCYIAAERGREAEIEHSVRMIKGYFEGYETEITFTDEEEVTKKKVSMYHRGRVVSAANGDELDLELSISSNPRFTANIMLSSVRAAVLLNSSGECGARTFFDIPPKVFLHLDASCLL